MRNKHILVTGLHRSGTTFVGKILSLPWEVSYIHEPSNKDSGLKGIDKWFPYIGIENPNNFKYTDIYKRLIDFNAQYKINIKKSDSFMEKTSKSFLGGKSKLYYQKARLFSFFPGSIGKCLLLKDPLGAFISDYLSTYHNFKVLVLIRHPGAFYVSIKRLNWHFNFKNFLTQNDLIDGHLEKLAPLMKKSSMSFAEEAGLLWHCIYTVLSDFIEKHDDWLIMKHEDICKDPLNSFKRIFQWANLNFSRRINRKLELLTASINSVKAEENKVHDLYRNSRKLTDYWKEKVSKENLIRIKDITLPLSLKYYNTDSWLL